MDHLSDLIDLSCLFLTDWLISVSLLFRWSIIAKAFLGSFVFEDFDVELLLYFNYVSIC